MVIDSMVDSQIPGLITDLQTLIRQPSVSARKRGLIECANLIAKIMNKAGINSEVLYLDDKKNIPPIIYGEVKSKENPNAKTILFYNHYDVQPEDPVELWEAADPFSGKVEGNYIFGRGAADDKGELITRIKAVESFLKNTGDIPCNVKFIVEGEEEIGSPHLQDYLLTYREKLSCDGVIWEFGIIDEEDRPIIELGVKGILSVELFVKGPSRDAHSSLAVLIKNPAWRLVKALNTICDDTQRILVRDWYKEVREFTAKELAVLSDQPYDEQKLKKEYGIDEFINSLQGVEDIKKVLAGMPTCNIAGLISGYTDEGAKTVLPSTALAKMDFRLVPDMMPEKQLERLRDHLKENGFTDIEVKFIDGEPAARTDLDHDFVRVIEESAKMVFGTAIISVSSAGTGPMYYFNEILRCPSVCVGSTYVNCRAHSPNEFARIDLLINATKCICAIIAKFASCR